MEYKPIMPEGSHEMVFSNSIYGMEVTPDGNLVLSSEAPAFSTKQAMKITNTSMFQVCDNFQRRQTDCILG